MVNFDVNFDAKEVNKMLDRYGREATREIERAVNDTIAQGYRTAVINTPHRVGNLKKSWRDEKRGLSGTIYNFSKYVVPVNNGWSRTRPIRPKKAKALVFQVGKKTAAKSDTTTLYRRHKKAMKSLAGKGLSPRQKAAIATKKSGVVVTKSVNSPARFKGYKFIDNKIFPRISRDFELNIKKALNRLIR